MRRGKERRGGDEFQSKSGAGGEEEIGKRWNRVDR